MESYQILTLKVTVNGEEKKIVSVVKTFCKEGDLIKIKDTSVTEPKEMPEGYSFSRLEKGE